MKTYTVTREESLKHWPTYVIAVGRRKLAKVWSHSGYCRLYVRGKLQQVGPGLPMCIDHAQSCTATTVFLMCADAFGYKIAVDWSLQIAKNLPFDGVLSAEYTESDLFELVLDARQDRISSIVAPRA